MDKLHFMVCPHDTSRHPERWFVFSQFLTSHVDVPIHLDFSVDFSDFHQHYSEAGLVYANPNDSLRHIEERGFIPLAHPKNHFDEVVFVANPNRLNWWTKDPGWP